jgi:hypothetical protein
MVSNKITVEGREFNSRAAAAKFYGKKPRLVNRRVTELKWSIEQALELSPRTSAFAKQKVTVEGKGFPSRTAAARHYGIDPKLVNERVTKNKWTIEQALELVESESAPYSKIVVIGGVEFSSIREAAKHFDIKQSTLMNRIKSGSTVEQALMDNYEKSPLIKGQSKPLIYNNKLYPSPRHLLQDNPELLGELELDKVIATLSYKASKASKEGKVKNYSIDDIAKHYGLAKMRFLSDFEASKQQLIKRYRGEFYEVKPI